MAAQTVLRCTYKVRDNSGVIKQYVFQDNYGNSECLSRQETIKALKDKSYNITNLQLDSLGRIVEKKEVKTVNNIVKENGKLFAAFKEAYNNLQNGKELVFCLLDLGERFFTSSCEHQIRNVADNLGLSELYISEIEPAFERFIIQNGGKAVYKLHIKSKDGAFEGIILSINKDIENDDLNDFVRDYLENKDFYKRAENYMVKAYRIDTPNQLIKCYVAPDMSLITTKQDGQQGQQGQQSSKNKIAEPNKKAASQAKEDKRYEFISRLKERIAKRLGRRTFWKLLSMFSR